MSLVLLLARLILIVVFVVSAVAKLMDRSGSRQAVQDFGVPATLSGLVAAGLPVAELLCAVLLVFADPAASAGALLSILLLGSFTVAIVFNLIRGRRPDCHCFGQLSSAPTGWPTVIRNGFLLLLALLPLVSTDTLPSVPAQVASYSSQERWLGLVLGSLAVAVVVLGTLFRTLLSRYGDVLLRLEALEASTGQPVAAALPAPPFELPDLDGAMVSLPEVMAQQRPAILVFVSPSCTICGELLPDLQRWQAVDHPVSVVVVSIGSAEANRAKLSAAPKLRVLLQADREVATAYGSQGTPGAFLLGTDGMIAGAGAYGVEAIRQLHDSVLAAVAPESASVLSSEQHPPHVYESRLGAGDPLPPVTVETEAGESRELAELVDDSTVLLFWDVNCGFCDRIVADVSALEPETRILIVSRSDPGEIRASGLTSALVRDPDFGVGNALGIPGTPAAVLVREGTVDSAVVVGGPDVLALLERELHSVRK